MKLLRTALIALLTVAACSDGTGPDEPDAYVTASVGGTPWAANYRVGESIAYVEDESDLAVISGVEIAGNRSGRAITIVIYDFTGPGTYQIGGAAGVAQAAYETSSNVDSPTATEVTWVTDELRTGTVTVTAFDMASLQMRGSFNFSATSDGTAGGVITVTGGEFAGRTLVP